MDNQELEEKILKIDKSKWKPTKLGTLAEDISVRVDKPGNSEYDRFVGLDNFISGDIKIKSWASTENLTSSAKAFKAGDILFARRNAYLRRASLVDFDGCCSGDAFVIRENLDKVVPGFLAFLMNTNSLWDYANSNAAGTMSKRVKWRDLAEYEFLLPPKAEQGRLAELLWAMDDVIEKEQYLLDKLALTKKALFDSTIYESNLKMGQYFIKKKSRFNEVKLGELLSEIQYGISESLEDKGEVPILRMNNLQGGKLVLDDIKYYNPKDGELNRFMLNKGDVLFNRTNSFELVGKVSLFDEEEKYSFASYLIRLKADDSKLDSRYLNFYLNSPIGLAKIRKYRTPGVSQSNINAQNLKHIHIPYAGLKIQSELMDKIERIEFGELSSSSKILSSQSLQKSLINQIF